MEPLNQKKEGVAVRNEDIDWESKNEKEIDRPDSGGFDDVSICDERKRRRAIRIDFRQSNRRGKAAGGPGAPPGLLMSALGKAGLAGPLDKAGINIYGYIEGGYFYDATSQAHKSPTFIGFNSFKNTGILDNISLNVERTVDPAKKQFDVGFRVEGLFGADAAFIHSNGIGDTQTSRYQWDLLQAYVDVTLPGVPVKIRAGKWIELAGFEHFSANIYGAFGDPARALYSYSYQFLYAEPGTQTGVLVTYVLSPKWTFDAGFTRGWNQSTKDANGALDFLGRVTYTPSDKTSIIFVMTEGPEFPTGVGHNLPKGDSSHWWTALDLVATQKITDKLSLGLGFDYVYAPQIPGLTSGAKQWGGVAGYVKLRIGSARHAQHPAGVVSGRRQWLLHRRARQRQLLRGHGGSGHQAFPERQVSLEVAVPTGSSLRPL